MPNKSVNIRSKHFQHLPTQASPHYLQLEPITYDSKRNPFRGKFYDYDNQTAPILDSIHLIISLISYKIKVRKLEQKL